MFQKITIFIILPILALLAACQSPALTGAASPSPTVVTLPPAADVASETTAAPTTTPLPLPSPTPSASMSTVTFTPQPMVKAQPVLEAQPVVETESTVAGQPLIEPQATANASRIVSPTTATAPIAPTTSFDSLTGAWDFNFGKMSLTEQNGVVKGTYQWYGGGDQGEIRGVIVRGTNQFRGLWLSDRSPTEQGFLQWRLAPDKSSLTGTFDRRTSGQWCGVRSGLPLPAGCGFSGAWHLRFGHPPGLTGQADLVQTGNRVEGTFTASDGRSGDILEGVVSVSSLTELKLTGIWRNDRGEQDSFEWRMDLTTGRTFQGRRDPGNSEWCGWRPDADEPQSCGWDD